MLKTTGHRLPAFVRVSGLLCLSGLTCGLVAVSLWPGMVGGSPSTMPTALLPALAPPEASTLSDVDADALNQLLGELSLDAWTLARAGCDGGDALRVYGAVRTWFEAHRARLRTTERSIRAAHVDLREMYRGFHVGGSQTPSSGALRAARSSLDRALEDRRVLLSECELLVRSTLPSERVSRWQSLRGPARGPSPIWGEVRSWSEHLPAIEAARRALAPTSEELSPEKAEVDELIEDRAD